MGLISRVSSRTYRNITKKNMKLLTHNFLQSIVKGVSKPYPLTISPTKIEENEVEFSDIAVTRMIDRLDYNALLSGLKNINCSHNLPEIMPENYQEDMEFLKKMHHALFEIEVIEGDLLCEESGRKFPIMRGIPNMLLTEEEV